jgi:hypothetical protein
MMMRSGRETRDDFADQAQAVGIDLHRWRIARIDDKERLNRRIAQLVEFRSGILPAFRRIRVHLNFHQLVVIQLGNLDIGREDRRAEGDLVAWRQQSVFAQRIEYVCYARSAAFDREQIRASRPQRAADQFPLEVVAHDDFRDGKDAGRGRIVAGENPGRQLVQERRRGEAELIADVGDCRIEEGDPRHVSMGRDEGVKARLDSLESRMPADAFRHVGEGALSLQHGEQPELEKSVARDGRQEVRVAATGVEHQALGVTGRQARQLILDLERTELRQFGVIDRAHL